MDIKTKYDAGQDVWVVRDNKVIRDKITDIVVTIKSSHLAGRDNILSVVYKVGSINLCGERTSFYVDENKVFIDKDDILQSL